MKQKHIFLEGEGDRWFERNHDKPHVDEITPLIAAIIPKPPQRVLEIGCGTGRTLATIRDRYRCEVMGIDPSLKAVMEAASLRVPAMQGTASSLPVGPDYFDLIIYGFALYLTDPDDWLLIASEADRVLVPGGHIIIQDFGGDLRLHGVTYKHDDRITSWHFDWSKLWLGHPGYEIIWRHWTKPDGDPDRQMITVLRKNEVMP